MIALPNVVGIGMAGDGRGSEELNPQETLCVLRDSRAMSGFLSMTTAPPRSSA